MKKTKKVVEKFLAELERTPIVGVASERSGLSRNTVYRWRNEDSEFASNFELALARGVSVVNDVAESNVLSGIRDKEYRWTVLWLKAHHPSYRYYARITERENPLKDPARQEYVKQEVQRIFRQWGAYDTPRLPEKSESKKRRKS